MRKRFRVIEESDHEDKGRDIPDSKTIQLRNNKIIVTKSGQFGYYSIHYEKGITPPTLRGDWLSYSDAAAAVRRYLDGRINQPDESF